MSNLRNDFASYWKDYGIKHGLDTDSKCIEHAVRDSIKLEKSKEPTVFDWKRYIADHPDLQRTFGKGGRVHVNDATCHYLSHGKREGRKTFILGTDQPYVYDFDWKMYDKLNPDVFTQRHRANVGEWHCFRHWCEYGYKEGRKTTITKLVVKNDASISTDEGVNKMWKSELENIIGSYINIDMLVIDATKTTFNAMKDNIDNNMLKNIYQNIDEFSKFIEPYKNVLFICSDYPGYGGAATNCDNLSKYYEKMHNVHTIYWTYSHNEKIKNNSSNLYTIVSSSKIQSTLETLTFKPDIIILKNSLGCDLTKIFKCPTIFLVPGIYKNELNEHYTMLDTIEKQNKYINQSTLTQIRNSTYSFCNSSHTQDILKKWYGLNTDLFCSTFINFYKQTIQDDPEFYNRKYNYGLIISDYSRTIKNVEKSIDFLKDKQNVILIGSGSSKFKSYGFECIELVDNNKMPEYYKQIKYIVQDSFYESCSNIKVEGLFHGCKIFINLINSGLIFTDNNNVIVVSENSPGVGGFGEIAHKIFNHIEHKKKTLLYFNYEKSEETNNIKYILFDNQNEYYNFMKNILITDSINKKFKSLPISDNTTFFVCSPYTLLIIYKYFPSHKIIYYCGSIVIKPNINENNIFNFSNDNFAINPFIKEIINKNNITCVSTTQLSKHYLNLYSNKCENTFIPLNKCRNLNEKKYDLICVVSDITRPDKNVDLCIDLFKQFPNLKKILIGKHATSINIENLITYEFIPNDEVNKLMLETKICIITSNKDVGPTTFIEAIQNNCIPIISKTCGFSKISNNEYYKYASDLNNKKEWVNTINKILTDYDILKKKFCYHIYEIIQKSNCNIDEIINMSYLDNYSLVIFNENSITDHILNLQNDKLIRQAKKYQIIDFNNTHIDQACSKYTLIVNDSILIYNWKTYTDYNNFNEIIFQHCKYPITGFNVLNSDKKVFVVKNNDVKITHHLINYRYRYAEIDYIDKYIGIQIKNIPKTADIGIIFIQQFKDNVFESYLNDILDYYNQSSTIVNLYIYYGNNTPVGEYTNKNINIKYINEYNMHSEIKTDCIKVLYYLYLPLQFITYRKQFDQLIYDKTIKHIVFIAGGTSHMIKYIELYNIKHIVIKGESEITNQKLNDKRFTITNILFKPSIFKLEKYRKTDYKLNNNFVIIARFDYVKNIMFAVKAFSIFLKYNKNHKLYIIGDGSYQKEELSNYIDENKLHNIILMKWLPHDKIFEFVKNNIDYNISTSISEGIQGTILETMICGVPTICSNIMGNRTIVSDKINGLLFNFNNYTNIIRNFPSHIVPSKIMECMDENINSLVNVLNLTVNNIKLYNNLSKGAIKFVEDNKFDICNINYNKIFFNK